MGLKVIVVGNDHYNTLNVVRALGVAGFSVDVWIISEKSKSFVLKSRYAGEGGCVREDEVIDFLLSKYKAARERIPLITTYDGAAVLVDSKYDRLSGKFCLPSVGHVQGRLIEAMNKDFQVQAAADAGMHVPGSISLNLTERYERELDDVDYPCIVKPRESFKASKEEFRICENREKLVECLESLNGVVPEVLVQQFIPNDEVIVVGGVRTPQGEVYIYGEVNKEKHSSSSHNLGLCCLGYWERGCRSEELCRRLLKDMDYYGCFSIDFIRSHGHREGEEKDYFIEVNLRTDGLFFFYTQAAVNYPAIWASACYGLPVEVAPAEKRIIGMNEILYLRNYLSLSSIGDFFKTDVFSTFSFKDFRPFLFRILNKL